MTASKVKIKKVFEWCGQEFIAWKVSTRFCSKQCNSHAYKDAIRKRVLLQTEQDTMEKADKISASNKSSKYILASAATTQNLALCLLRQGYTLLVSCKLTFGVIGTSVEASIFPVSPHECPSTLWTYTRCYY